MTDEEQSAAADEFAPVRELLETIGEEDSRAINEKIDQLASAFVKEVGEGAKASDYELVIQQGVGVIVYGYRKKGPNAHVEVLISVVRKLMIGEFCFCVGVTPHTDAKDHQHQATCQDVRKILRDWGFEDDIRRRNSQGSGGAV